MKKSVILASLLFVSTVGWVFAQSGTSQSPYRRVDNWPKPNGGRVIGSVSAIDIDPDGRSIWIADACGNTGSDALCHGSNLAPIIKLDSSGAIVASFGAGMFSSPHGIHIDRDGNIRVVDRLTSDGMGQQVIKLNGDGKVLLRLGKAGIAGTGPDMFSQPCDVVTAASGDIFVADGHDGVNPRLVKFSKDGKFIKEWGRKGTAPGEFETAHGIVMDARGRILVGDRRNDRVQIFDQDGNYLAETKQFGRPTGLYIDGQGTLFTTTGFLGGSTGMMGFLFGALDGNFTSQVSYKPAQNAFSEGIAVDRDASVYLSQTNAGGVLKEPVRNFVCEA